MSFALPRASLFDLNHLKDGTLRLLYRRRSHPWAAALFIGGATLLTAYLSRKLSPSPEKGATRRWYRALEKPGFTPPPAVFGPVWGTLYVASAVSAWRVWRSPDSHERTTALKLWASHLGVNALWSKLFFGEKRAIASLSDVGADLAMATGFTYYASQIDKTAGILAAPLTLWLILATALNEEIVRKNPGAFRMS